MSIIVDDLPHVTPVSKEEKTRMDAQKDVSANKQFVFSMNMEEWKVCHQILLLYY